MRANEFWEELGTKYPVFSPWISAIICTPHCTGACGASLGSWLGCRGGCWNSVTSLLCVGGKQRTWEQHLPVQLTGCRTRTACGVLDQILFVPGEGSPDGPTPFLHPGSAATRSVPGTGASLAQPLPQEICSAAFSVPGLFPEQLSPRLS